MSDENNTVNPVTLQFKRAFKNVEEVYSCMKRLVEENRERDIKSGAIMRRYNDEPIWNQNILKANAQGWRRNVSTGFLSSMVKRVCVPFKQAVNRARVLTSSKFSANTADLDSKSTMFQEEITKTIRRWKDWRSFISRAVLEDVLFGFVAVIWTDEFEWRPKIGRNDEAHFPDGTPETETGTPFFTFYQSFQIHELAEKLKEPDISADAGWNIKNLIQSINDSMPEDRRSKTDNERSIEDTYRESSVGMSYSKGVKVVQGKHMFCVEPGTGMVTQYILDYKTGKELFVRYDRFQNIDECLRLITIEDGNGKLHGSKGLGRLIYNTALATEQARNLIHDALYLSGLIWVKSSTKDKDRVALKVSHPVVTVDESFDVIDKGKIEVNVEAFFALDRHMVQIAELQGGQFVAGQILDQKGEKRTATEVDYVANIESQVREGVLERFWGQFQGGVIFNMQRRICSTDNIKEAMVIHKSRTENVIQKIKRKIYEFAVSIGRVFKEDQIVIEEEDKTLDQEAIDCIVNMLSKDLTPEEIFELANTPTMETNVDSIENAQAIAAVVAKYSGDPSIRQSVLKQMDISTQLGYEKTKELIIPEEDNTIQVEAETKQITEMILMANGQEIEVSPRDEDIVHLDTILARGQSMIAAFSGGAVPETIDILKRTVAHADKHVQSALGKGRKQEELGQYIDFIEQAKQQIGQVPIVDPAAMSPQMPAGAQPAMLPPEQVLPTL